MSETRGRQALWTLAGALSFWSYGYTQMKGSDLFWHVAAGRQIAETGSPWLVDAWSYTRDGMPWLNHEWLSQLVFFAWSGAFGLESLVYWKWALIVATFALLQRALTRASGAPLAGWLSALGALAVAAPFLDIRPQLYTFLAYALLVERCWLREPPRWIPLLFLVWANLHSGVIFGLLALGALLLPGVLAEPRRAGAAALLWGASAAACLLNPHGVGIFSHTLEFALGAAGEPSAFANVAEWRSPFAPGPFGSPLFPAALGVFAAAGAALLAWPAARPRGGSPWAALLLGVATLAMASTSKRFIPLFAMSAALSWAPVLAAVGAPLRRRAPAAIAPWAAVALGLVWLWPYPKTSDAFHYLVAEDTFPVDTLDFMEANELTGRVFAPYAWGGYLHLRSGGRLRVYIDGRANQVYDDDTYAAYLRVLRLDPGWMEVVESGAEYVLWSTRNDRDARLRGALLATGRWHSIHRGARSELLARGPRAPGPFRDPPDSPWRSLALGQQALEGGDAAGAIPHLERSLELLPHLRTSCQLLAVAQAESGRNDQARATLARCQRTFPGAAGLARSRERVEGIASQRPAPPAHPSPGDPRGP